MEAEKETCRIWRGYTVKFKHLGFLERRLAPGVLERLTRDFDSLWEIEGEKCFPRLTEFPSGARRVLHPAEKDHEVWEELKRLNLRILEVPARRVEEAAARRFVDPSKARGVAARWEGLRELAAKENAFIDEHSDTMLDLVSQCPGRWVDKENYRRFRRMANDLPGFIEALRKDVRSMRRLARDVEVMCREPLRINIIGIGEITTTIEVLGGKGRGLYDESGRRFHYAVKKLPPVKSKDAATAYGKLFDEYQLILTERAGLKLPRWGWWAKEGENGKAVLYTYQERLPQESNAALAVKRLDQDNCRRLFRAIAREIKKVCDFNRSETGVKLGFDGQLPNWCIEGYEPERRRITGGEELYYIDTSTPMMRKGGPDLLDTSIFLKTVPAPLRPFIKKYVLPQVLNRYYRPRDVVMDLVASFYLYERPDMVPVMVEEANAFFDENMADYDIEPLAEREMRAYHRTDTMIWVFFRAVKRLDKFVQERILRRRYVQRLPDHKFVPGPFVR